MENIENAEQTMKAQLIISKLKEKEMLLRIVKGKLWFMYFAEFGPAAILLLNLMQPSLPAKELSSIIALALMVLNTSYNKRFRAVADLIEGAEKNTESFK